MCLCRGNVAGCDGGGVSSGRKGLACRKGASHSVGMERDCLPSICFPVYGKGRSLGSGLEELRRKGMSSQIEILNPATEHSLFRQLLYVNDFSGNKNARRAGGVRGSDFD